MEFETLFENMTNACIVSDAELTLVCNVAGSTVETLETVLFVQTGYRTWEQYMED